MNCHEVHDAIDTGFTSVGIDITADIREHLDACPECMAYYDELRGMVELLHPLDNLELTPVESKVLLNGLEQATARFF